jgi:hypothetical protein
MRTAAFTLTASFLKAIARGLMLPWRRRVLRIYLLRFFLYFIFRIKIFFNYSM